MPPKIADEVRAQLGDDNAANYVRQIVSRYFHDAKSEAQEKALGAFRTAMKGKTAACHPRSVGRLLPTKPELTTAMKGAISAWANHLNDDSDRQTKLDLSQIPHVRLNIDGLPGGLEAFAGNDGVYLKGLGFTNFAGPLPPGTTPTGDNPSLTPQLERAVRAFVRERVDRRGNGFIRLEQAPVEDPSEHPRVLVDAADLMSQRRDAYLIGGHLYASYEVGSGHDWFYLGPLPADAAKITAVEPELPAPTAAYEYMAANPEAQPARERQTPFAQDRDSWIATLDADLAAHVSKNSHVAADFGGHGPSAKAALAKLKDAGVSGISLFIGNHVKDPKSVAGSAVKAIAILHDQLGDNFINAVATTGRAQITDQRGSIRTLVMAGGLADTAAQGTDLMKGGRPATIEFNLAPDVPRLRVRTLPPSSKQISCSGDDAARTARKMIESYYESGPMTLVLKCEKNLFRSESPSAEDVHQAIQPVVERALELGLITEIAPMEKGTGFALTIPETRYDLPA